MHISEENLNPTYSLSGVLCLFSSYSGNSRGVGVLFNNNFELDIHKVKKVINGNFIIIDIIILTKY